MNDFKYSVLIVEDEFFIRKFYVEILKDKYEIFETRSAEEAYEIYLNTKPNILLVDINLPKANGLSLVEKIRKTDLNTKIIVISGNSQEEYLLSANSLRLNAYLLKPVEEELLVETLDKAKEELSEFTIIHNHILFINENFKWNYKEKNLYEKNKRVLLTNKEEKVLNLLIENRFKVTTYEFLLNEVWFDTLNDDLSVIKTIVKKLRKKLPQGLIENIYGQGYRFLILNDKL